MSERFLSEDVCGGLCGVLLPATIFNVLSVQQYVLIGISNSRRKNRDDQWRPGY
jgi:hypothetical protein